MMRRVVGSLMAVWLACGLLLGCNTFDPSKWNQEQVAKEITEQWKLSDVSLSPSAGGFSGSGKTADGETFEITVKMDTANKSVIYAGKGNRGTELDYKVYAQTVR
jgi:hypothetical protein